MLVMITSLFLLFQKKACCSKGSAHAFLRKELKVFPYKITIGQVLSVDHKQRRLTFCTSLLNKINSDPSFLFTILWTDECSFKLSGHVNRPVAPPQQKSWGGRSHVFSLLKQEKQNFFAHLGGFSLPSKKLGGICPPRPPLLRSPCKIYHFSVPSSPICDKTPPIPHLEGLGVKFHLVKNIT